MRVEFQLDDRGELAHVEEKGACIKKSFQVEKSISIILCFSVRKMFGKRSEALDGQLQKENHLDKKFFVF
jgi:hypothetical protein